MLVKPEDFKDRAEYKYVVFSCGFVCFCDLQTHHENVAGWNPGMKPVAAGKIMHLGKRFNFSESGSLSLGFRAGEGGCETVSAFLSGHGISESEDWLFY